jgi:lysophospholipase L1-like esterase
MNISPTATTVLCFGDSNTWGQKPDKSGRYPADIRWPGVLQKILGDAYYIIEEGLSSRTTDLDYAQKPGRNGRTYLEPCLDSQAPLDVVILMLGSNDLKIEFNRSAEDIAKAIRGLIGLIQTKTSRNDKQPARVLLVSPIYVNDEAPDFTKWYTGFYDHESVGKSQALAGLLQSAATDLGCYFVDAATVAQAGEDGLHFDQPSHPALGTLLAQEVKHIMANA